MTRRAFLCYGFDGDSAAGVDVLTGLVDWCAWFAEHTSDLDLTVFWSSYVSETGDQTLEESLALMEAHSHVILIGEMTPRLEVQRDHAVENKISMVDLTSFGRHAPQSASTGSFLVDLVNRVLEVPDHG